MISIITAIYNQIEMNRLYLESIRRCTVSDWELIVIDNGSDDGSAEFFENAGDNIKVIRNDGNYSYPYCQNQGIKIAEGDIYAFLNNDIMLSRGWDIKLSGILGKDGYEAVTLVSNDNMVSHSEASHLNRRFKRLKYPLLTLFGRRQWVFRLMLRLTYGNWDKFCNKVWNKYGLQTKPGFAGSAVVMTKKGVDLLGEWDETQQGGDFDLFFKSMERWRNHGDVRPLSLVGGIYHHHFSRITFRCAYPPFKDIRNHSTLEAKWGADKVQEYTALINKN
jgi:glycosyltransferase, family 2